VTSADVIVGTRKVIDVLVSARRDANAARRFFQRAASA
jgi:transposase-like protein